MNADQPQIPSTHPDPILDARLRQAARAFAYPPTPNLRASFPRRGPAARQVLSPVAWVGIALAGLLLAALLVSPVRARVLEWLRIGAVRIVLVTPTPSAPAQVITATPAAPGMAVITATPAPTDPASTPGPSLPDLAGAITLAEAVARAPFPLRLPDYPPGLGEPQQVFFQLVERTPVVIMAWTDPALPRLALYQVGKGELFEKRFMENMQETRVNGEWALWVEGPYLLTMTGGQIEQRRVIEGRTLVWVENGITYRLETDLPLDEARKIAESLSVIEP